AGLYGAKAAGKNRILLPQGERRRFRRQMSPQGVTVATRAGRAPARVKNVSEGGLLVSLREAVPLGSAVSLTIERIGTTPVGLRGQVVRVERVPGEIEPAFDVGVRFLDPGDATPLLTTV
ncbi:MAG: PilZ domain-containing protein, partial [Burkholderiales bacterium]